MDWKRVPKIDKELVQDLKEKFSTPKYDPEATNDELVRLLAVQYGRDEAIAAIESLITLQQKRR